jgi:hypothetical protein
MPEALAEECQPTDKGMKKREVAEKKAADRRGPRG